MLYLQLINKRINWMPNPFKKHIKSCEWLIILFKVQFIQYISRVLCNFCDHFVSFSINFAPSKCFRASIFKSISLKETWNAFKCLKADILSLECIFKTFVNWKHFLNRFKDKFKTQLEAIQILQVYSGINSDLNWNMLINIKLPIKKKH